jgi:menaquinone-dependent protoporphyrinogen oxidase
MPRILIVYGTTYGHTATVAGAIAVALRARGARVDIATASPAAPAPAGYDGVIVAASIVAGGYQKPVIRWVRQHRAALDTVPTAFVSVCLGVLQADPAVQRTLGELVERFKTLTGWTPGEVKLVAGALLYTHYNWILRLLMKRIARKAGGGTDTRRDYVYTDWADLDAFARLFARRVGAATALPAA